MRRRRTVPALLLALSIFFALLALTGSQATGASAGPRLLGRLAAALFELDRWTPQHKEELQTVARERIRGPVDVQGLPIRISVASGAALGSDDELATAIAAAAGEALYWQGRSAFVDGDTVAGDISITRPVRWAIDLLRSSHHRAWQGLLFVTAMLSACALLLMLAASTSGLDGAIRAITRGGSAYSLAMALLWASCAAGAGRLSGPDREVARMLGSCASMGLLDGIAISIGCLAALVALRQFRQAGGRLREWPAALDEPA